MYINYYFLDSLHWIHKPKITFKSFSCLYNKNKKKIYNWFKIIKSMSYLTTTEVSTAGAPSPAASRLGAANAVFYTACVRTALRVRLRTTAVIVTAFCLKILCSFIYPGIFSGHVCQKFSLKGFIHEKIVTVLETKG